MIDSQLPFDLNMGNLSQEVSWMLEKEKDNMERDYYINGAVKSDNPSWEIKMAFGLLLLQKVMGRNKSPSARPSPPRQQNSGKPSGMGSMMEGGVMGQVLPLLTSFFGNSTPAPQLRPLGAHVAPQTPGLRTPLMPINTSNLNSQRTALFPEFPDTGTPYVDLEALTKRTLAGMDTLDALTDVSDIPDL